MLSLVTSLWLALFPAHTKTAATPVTTCQWPNTCAEKVEVAQFQPCVWPNRCAANS